MPHQDDKTYDFVIAGCGCAGLSLAVALKQSNVPFKKVLLIDKAEKTQNDRTWCYWSREQNNWYDQLCYRRWEQFIFRDQQHDLSLHLSPYKYSMIRGIDFYDYCRREIKNDIRFEWLFADIHSLSTKNNIAHIVTSEGGFDCRYAFNSAIHTINQKRGDINYVQHFKGWMVSTADANFDAATPVFMDFSVPQYNDCRFIYILPHTQNTALVEYTGFSPAACTDDEYDQELTRALDRICGKGKWELIETEKGIIPMYESDFINPFGKSVINMGTAGGNSKGSTGFTFYNIQQQVKSIVRNLEQGRTPGTATTRKKRFQWYDKIFLRVLASKDIAAYRLFLQLFENNRPSLLLAFLNEESNILQDVKLMSTAPVKIFARHAFRKIFNLKEA